MADEETDETFIVVHLEGGGINDHGQQVIGLGGMGSWNTSRTNGPLGPPCTVPRPKDQPIECYRSCQCMLEKY